MTGVVVDDLNIDGSLITAMPALLSAPIVAGPNIADVDVIGVAVSEFQKAGGEVAADGFLVPPRVVRSA